MFYHWISSKKLTIVIIMSIFTVAKIHIIQYSKFLIKLRRKKDRESWLNKTSVLIYEFLTIDESHCLFAVATNE